MCLHVCVCVCSLWWAQELRLSLDVQKPALHTVQFKDSSLKPSGRVDQSAALSPTSPCLAWGGSSRGDSFAGHRTSHMFHLSPSRGWLFPPREDSLPCSCPCSQEESAYFWIVFNYVSICFLSYSISKIEPKKYL